MCQTQLNTFVSIDSSKLFESNVKADANANFEAIHIEYEKFIARRENVRLFKLNLSCQIHIE